MNRSFRSLLCAAACHLLTLPAVAGAQCVDWIVSVESSLEIESWFADPSVVTGVTGIAQATAAQVTMTISSNGVFPCSLLTADLQLVPGTASANEGRLCSDRHEANGTATVRAAPSAAAPNSVRINTTSSIAQVCSSPHFPNSEHLRLVFGSASAGYDATYTLDGATTVLQSGTVSVTVTLDPNGANRPVYLVTGSGGAPATATLWDGEVVSDGLTLTPDSGTPGEITYTGVIDGSTAVGAGDFDGTLRGDTVTDDAYDFDGDERFSCLDVAQLQALVDSGGLPYDERFDFVPDFVIDQLDVDYVQGLLDAGAGAGRAGDGDGDCTVGCADLALADAALGSVFGDASYRLALDTDLDMDVDSDDRAFIDGLVTGTCSPADLNGDGCVDGADLGILLAAWGPCPGCPADLNGDGVVDGADLGILLAAWSCG